jgi:amino acid adenylation domain-containing protein
MSLLLHRFEMHASQSPANVAVRSNGVEVAYGELNRQADAVAAALSAQGAQRGDIVGLCATASIGRIAAMIGILKSGCAWVPMDPKGPAPRLQEIVRQAGVKIVMTGGDTTRLPVGPRYLEIASAIEVSGQAPDIQVRGDDLCYLMFTSGSTGVPNGVMVTHGNIAGLFDGLQAELEFSAADRWSGLHAFTFGYSVWETWGALSTGAALEIIPDGLRRNPLGWMPLVVDAEVSILSITPSGFRQLLAADCLPEALPFLRLVVFSGEAVNADDLEVWQERYGTSGPRLINTYALTETAGRIAWLEYLPDATIPAGSIGRPVKDTEILLLDEAKQPVSPGETGELYVHGPMLASGYLGNTELSNERFPWLAGGGSHRRFYRTGDRARESTDGQLIFVGRTDDQVKLRGHRIELGEIERTIRLHPEVRDAAVVLDETANAPRLIAYIVPETGAALKNDGVEFWPSLGEYQIYDELLYDFMSADEIRVASYRRAFERSVNDKVVLDIGTGKDAILARLAAAAGARKVYAVEVLHDAFASARSLVSQLGLDERIEVLHGDMNEVTLPEPIDVCAQGIVGNIGSSDGIVPIWNSARPNFAPGFTAVPAVCTTYFAPAELPSEAREAAAFGSLAADYTRTIFEAAGKRFDVRLCVRNFPADRMLADASVFEELDFGGELTADYSGNTDFVVTRGGCFDGFLLWTELQTDTEETVDFLAHQQAWLPVWFPLADEPVELEPGDRIEARWNCITPAGQVFPDYELHAKVLRSDGSLVELSYVSRHFETACGQTRLHRSLLDSLDKSAAGVEDWLHSQLPAHMQPAAWQQLNELPLNNSGKLDRQRLRDVVSTTVAAEAPVECADPFENAVAAIWSDVLGRKVSHDEDFFAAGGDSILAVRLTTEIQRFLDDAVFLAALFDAPTVTAYAAWLRANHQEAVARNEANLLPAPVAEFRPGPRDETPVPLAYPQQSLWFLQQLYPENTGANEQFLIRIRGAADSGLLREAWRRLLNRHDILRMHIVAGEQGEVVQRASSVDECMRNDSLPVISLEHLSSDDAARELKSAARLSIAEAFDLRSAPLLRTRMFKLPGNETVLLVTAHHIVADGMCVQLIRDELALLYGSPELPQPAYQYADFARWQRATPTDAQALQWWCTNLEGHSGQPVSMGAAPAAAEGDEKRFAFELDADLVDQLREVAARAGATPFMLLLAAWRVWLSRCLGENDLLLGSPVTLRRDDATARMLGCMVNNVVLRSPLEPDASFLDVLRAERTAVLEALEHSDVPFERVVEAVRPERQLGRHPLFQLMFLFEDRSAAPATANTLEFLADVLPVDRASYWDLELSITDCGPGNAMQAFIGVRRDVYDAEALAWWPEGIRSLLAAVAVEPGCNVADLPLLSVAQRQQILVDWNDTSMPAGPEQTLHEMVFAQAARTPEALAVVDGDACLSYAELQSRADEMAARLHALGVSHGNVVGLCVPRSADAIVLQLAILKCGAAWLPLDPSYPGARLAAMVKDASPSLILHKDQPGFSAPARCVSLAELNELESADVTGFPDIDGDDVAYVLYTSGSTGIPKGVLAKHGSAVSRCRWMWREYEFSPADIFGQRTSLNFVDSVWEIFGALAHGASVNVLPVSAEQDPAAIAAWLNRNQISHIALIPPLLRALLDATRDDGAPGALHTLISSGETLPAELATRVHAAWPDCRLLNTYGTSETWDVSCFEVVPEQLGSTVPVGKPVANASLCILDERLQPVPPGVEGELYAGGIGLARAYLGRPDLTDSAFIRNPFGELCGARLYKTGDRARFRADGNVELLGRRDRQIKLRGIRIEAGDIEAQVLRRSDIKECAVVPRTAEGGAEWLALYVVPAGDAPDSDELRGYLGEHLPRTMVPADICVLEKLPLTPSGKLDTSALPVNAEVQSGVKYVAPRNPLERQLCDIWRAALGQERVGIHDNFFALRGHSLLATQVIARIGEEQQLEIPLQFIFESPTVAGLARSIEALRWAALDGDVGQGDDSGREVVRL